MLASLIHKAGFLVLLATNGEPLSFASAPGQPVLQVNAVVNRNVNKGREFWLREGEIDFTTRGLTEVELLKSALANRPVAGQAFTDGSGFLHRVRYVTQSDTTWICCCTVSPPAP